MCRSNKDGGRRCPGCGGFKAVAKANGNRRLGRLARKIVEDHLAELGFRPDPTQSRFRRRWRRRHR